MNPKLDHIAGILKLHPPSPRFVEERFHVFKQIDGIVMDNSLTCEGGEFDIGGENREVEVNPLRDLYIHQMYEALSEIETCDVDSGLVVWQLYNMGYIVKTPSVTMGFDVVRGPKWRDWDWDIPDEIVSGLARCMDVLFVTHYIDRYHTHPASVWLHVDHCDMGIIRLMQEDGKPVFIPTGHEDYFDHSPRFVYTGHHQSHHLLGLKVTSYGGPHVYQDNPFETPLMVYEVITGEGKKVFFTGDFDYTTGSPHPYKDDIDVLFLHCGGVSPLYDDLNPYELGGDEDAFYLGVQRLRARIVVAGHLAELTHLPKEGRESYLMAFHILYRLVGEGDMKCLVMFWGERYHCRV